MNIVASTFEGEIEITVCRGSKKIERIVRPLRRIHGQPVVKYKRKLWIVRENQIDVTGPFLTDELPLPQQSPTQLAEKNVQYNFADMTQDELIQLDASERILVDAGPGTGKTHVACHRVAALIKRDIQPSRILIISFTRAAVFELRQRLKSTLENEADAFSVRLATIDSWAWSIQEGFSTTPIASGDYNKNINATLDKIHSEQSVRDYLQSTKHVIIDEAQDIVGPRAKLVLGLIDLLAPTCGITVFADPAQAIYGFSEEAKNIQHDAIFLLPQLVSKGFRQISLTEVHRTNSPKLLEIFTSVRSRVLKAGTPATTRARETRESIIQLADNQLGQAKELKLQTVDENTLVLMRRRVEVIDASSRNQDIPHRLRMSGFPARIPPWIAMLLWDYTGSRLGKTEFSSRWPIHLARPTVTIDPEAAWSLLVDYAGESSNAINVHKLREILARPAPPVPFTTPDYGDTGPILSTIHASKGREAEHVCLYLPEELQAETDLDTEEEVRIAFVGATRARRTLGVGQSSEEPASRTDGRVWRYTKTGKGKIQVEIGRQGDLNAVGIVGTKTFQNQTSAVEAQQYLANHPLLTGLRARKDETLDYGYALETNEGKRIGALSEQVSEDLKSIANFSRTWPPPSFLPYIRSIGLRTLAIRADDQCLEVLHEPWRSSGFMLAPMIVAWSPAQLGKKR
jgi:hypothetical protein